MSEFNNSIDNSWAVTEEERSILRERAQRLAKEPEESGKSHFFMEVLSFLLAGERYAVETRFVVETMTLRELTSLPGLPSFILGIVNIRGDRKSVV